MFRRRSAAPRTSLYDHALRLHGRTPDGPLPKDGAPYPDGELHRGRRPKRPEDPRRQGVRVARVLDRHFARTSAGPQELVRACHRVFVPMHPDESIAAAARRGEADRVRATGRWLVRHGDDRCAVLVGLALLAAVGTAEDIPLIRTIGLLSHHFGPLAAAALERIDPSARSLLWLAERSGGWGRVYLVEALCRLDHPDARPWLLRRAVDGDFLNGYFAGRVATVSRVHEEVDRLADDPELFDHVGRLMDVMTFASGMGLSLRHYPHAAAVLAAHARHAADLPPTVARFRIIAVLALHLATHPAEDSGCTEAQRAAVLAAYVAVLDREDWCATVRAALEAQDHWLLWFARERAPRLSLRVFTERSAAGGVD
ncbi:hypothetical protein [Streptomyces sp. FH025]|uniref:hypothetical protein n=1 Tax=Streptomyces sp. FH025 TaxID=2815937 RepID=UPI001A9E6584|nr:hypothetical protein [Streptomyces sp. FH025]MBO1417887.1 hypothetical protein [Streptomyces sp. FH025]